MMLAFSFWIVLVIAESVTSADQVVNVPQTNSPAPCPLRVSGCLALYNTDSSDACAASRDVITCALALDCAFPEVLAYFSLLQDLVRELNATHADCCESRYHCVGGAVDRWAGSPSHNVTSRAKRCEALVDYVTCQTEVDVCPPINNTALKDVLDQSLSVDQDPNSSLLCVVPQLQLQPLTTQECYLAHEQCQSLQPDPAEDQNDEEYCRQVISSVNCSVGLGCLSNITLRLVEVTTTHLLEQLDEPCEVADLFPSETAAETDQCNAEKTTCENAYVDAILDHNLEVSESERGGDLCGDLSELVLCMRPIRHCHREVALVHSIFEEEQVRIGIKCNITGGNGTQRRTGSPLLLILSVFFASLLCGSVMLTNILII
ncbi:uncharacterized protein LOC106012742 [Aplysia californica]|uniref:Uncharacterized protein LOC106012742 n=1 Tax=Aplysia californica TaxID=6500 RepID=A0ABM1A6X3_APLCA|nr:uncharacterized protein LOC106012742 [Aplysia californica]